MIETSRQVRAVVLGAAGVLAAAHAAPAVTSLGPLRRRLFPGLAGMGDPGHVALTFDDGPDPRSTPAFLDVLAEHQVSATFFLLGRMLRAAPDLGRELTDAGHEVAVHGWEHRCMLLRGPAATYDELARAMDAVVRTTGTVPRWYRPPYGVLSLPALVAARRLGLTPVLWTNWGRDWTRSATSASVRATVTRDLRGGGTVLLHDSDCTSAPDSWRRTLGALPSLLADVRGRGLTAGPLRDHALSRTGRKMLPARRGESRDRCRPNRSGHRPFV
ncbi:polysaccharide deacetylase family protein [Actinoallomurus bryophytorum]|uniref:Peptidoglycan/xylan/chitin deacetylase (PgdA/CDA1 family) n=1 Tax=Actinoallomurus bryophytorum TaxID=1490222 RepID=A0A543CIA7_9ACTN|nr:polysaccharide deacetylase family protein [Actinoallomurus bryophytorum]TQL96760.1 peptidoglycan/xylan/chitin deacetylase (PgdA/CDA1 family) [Actinoallomurus bryophytorum]